MADDLVIRESWQALRRFTNARIALGRSGNSLPTQELLAFRLAHARARDAVRAPFDAAGLSEELAAAGHEVVRVESAASNPEVYLRRPDLGGRLNEPSRECLEQRAVSGSGAYDAALVLADGLSALAVHRNALPLLALVAPRLTGLGWRLAPVVVASRARVALADQIGQLLRAEQIAILIGERPGLSAPDSLSIYLTYGPHPGRNDSERNCISNVRPDGLGYEAAADTLVYLMAEASRRKLTGVGLKDDRIKPAGEAIPG
jgi:ethanolamine ammonia-lyase small subunit